MSLPENNADSWRQLRVLIEEYSDDARNAPWQAMVRPFVSELEKLGLNSLFRAGMAMNHVVFSTVEHHGLRFEPRVTLEFRPAQEEVRIAYSKANIEVHPPPLLDVYVSAPSAVRVTLGALRRLWTESKPGVSMPPELAGERKPPAAA